MEDNILNITYLKCVPDSFIQPLCLYGNRSNLQSHDTVNSNLFQEQASMNCIKTALKMGWHDMYYD